MDRISKEEFQTVENELNELKARRELAKSNGEHEKIDELSESIEKYEAYLKINEIMARFGDKNPDEEKPRKAVGKAIKSAVEGLEDDEVVRHFTHALGKFSPKVHCYNPQPDLEWKFE